MAEIQLSYGIRDGVPIHITAITPERNGDKCRCVCPECGKALQARTLGKSGKAIHFAHKAKSNCQPETIIHWTAKYLLEKRINEAVSETRELLSEWLCKSCNGHFQTDLAKGVFSVKVEKRLDSFIPDVSTYNSDGSPILMIEVVNTNPPKPEKLEFARSKVLDLIEFKVMDDNSLRAIETLDILRASRMTPCRKASCGVQSKIVKQDALQFRTHEEVHPIVMPSKAPPEPEEDFYIVSEEPSPMPKWFWWVAGFIVVGIFVKKSKILKSLRRFR